MRFVYIPPDIATRTVPKEAEGAVSLVYRSSPQLMDLAWTTGDLDDDNLLD